MCKEFTVKKNKGFTFIELLVVITIMAVIFAAAVVSYTTISMNARNARRKSDIEAIRQALEMCRSIAGVYPTNIYPSDNNIVCDNSPTNTITMAVTPIDPKPCGTPAVSQYVYISNGDTYSITATCMENNSGTYSFTQKNP